MPLFGTRISSVDRSTHYHSPDRIDIHEHRAPTDDSIRMADEMREKCMKSILMSYKSNDNVFNYSVVVYELSNSVIDSLSQFKDIQLFVSIVVNGRSYKVNETISTSICTKLVEDPNGGSHFEYDFNSESFVAYVFHLIGLLVAQSMIDQPNESLIEAKKLIYNRYCNPLFRR